MPQGFAERKVLFLHSLIQTAKERHNAEVRRQRLAAAAPPRVRTTLETPGSTLQTLQGIKALTRAEAGPGLHLAILAATGFESSTSQ